MLRASPGDRTGARPCCPHRHDRAPARNTREMGRAPGCTAPTDATGRLRHRGVLAARPGVPGQSDHRLWLPGWRPRAVNLRDPRATPEPDRGIPGIPHAARVHGTHLGGRGVKAGGNVVMHARLRWLGSVAGPRRGPVAAQGCHCDGHITRRRPASGDGENLKSFSNGAHMRRRMAD